MTLKESYFIIETHKGFEVKVSFLRIDIGRWSCEVQGIHHTIKNIHTDYCGPTEAALQAKAFCEQYPNG